MTIPKNTICLWFDTDAEEAARIGLLNHVVDDGFALSRARELARTIAAQSIGTREE